MIHCSKCNGLVVHHLDWVNPNTGCIIGGKRPRAHKGETYCVDCETDEELVGRHDLEEQFTVRPPDPGEIEGIEARIAVRDSQFIIAPDGRLAAILFSQEAAVQIATILNMGLYNVAERKKFRDGKTNDQEESGEGGNGEVLSKEPAR